MLDLFERCLHPVFLGSDLVSTPGPAYNEHPDTMSKFFSHVEIPVIVIWCPTIEQGQGHCWGGGGGEGGRGCGPFMVPHYMAWGDAGAPVW